MDKLLRNRNSRWPLRVGIHSSTSMHCRFEKIHGYCAWMPQLHEAHKQFKHALPNDVVFFQPCESSHNRLKRWIFPRLSRITIRNVLQKLPAQQRKARVINHDNRRCVMPCRRVASPFPFIDFRPTRCTERSLSSTVRLIIRWK